MQIPTLPQIEFAIPQAMARTVELAYNLWWSWSDSATSLWSNLDPVAWEQTHNPIDFISSIDHRQWQVVSQLEAVQERYQKAISDLDLYLKEEDTWYKRQGEQLAGPVAYFCTEFGVHASVPFYSGGLGILAGDHLKSASDLGIPLVGIGLLFRRGYFRQEIEANGEQQHIYPSLDVRRLPVRPVASPTGGQLKVEVEFPDRDVQVAVWKLDVGRVPLLLLDTDIPENDVSDRPITQTLYVRGRAMRLCQEIVLGVGGVRVLAALGIEPAVWHINEGHAALALLELIRERTTAGAELKEATDSIKRQTIFTLHTPVPAGNEVFDRGLTDHYLKPLLGLIPVNSDQLADLGVAKGDANRFDLGALAIEMASVTNGVSKRHAEVATADWEYLIGGPVDAVTNGVHTPSWVGRDTGHILTDRFGPTWPAVLLEDPNAGAKGGMLTAEEIWSIHKVRKEIFTIFARGRLRRQFARHGVSPQELREVEDMLPNERLTLGFARRFASYKRATLMFTDLARFEALLTNPDMPVQVVFAGKAHPADHHGQDFIQQIFELSQRPSLKGHVFVLEDYDARIARFMVQGVDVWVNNPRPPMEASGTSGMKAAINGTLNLSVRDGWWLEGFNGKNGWAFGTPGGNHDQGEEDQKDAIAFYDIMEQEVVPAFYDQDEDGVSVRWMAMMQEAVASTLVAFSSDRMVADYARLAYFPMGTRSSS